jgi:catechol 2,3-dioxygenase-like lactoylglutathione lyase family enzyme
VNHVSVSARDLDESVAFYGELLGAVPVANPNFAQNVRWMALGDTQLHVFESDVQPTDAHHFGAEVDLDVLVAAHALAAERDVLDDEFGAPLVELPGDVVQLYLRDPSGNLVELDAIGASRLPDELRGQLRVLADVQPQDEEHASARLFIGAERPR